MVTPRRWTPEELEQQKPDAKRIAELRRLRQESIEAVVGPDDDEDIDDVGDEDEEVEL